MHHPSRWLLRAGLAAATTSTILWTVTVLADVKPGDDRAAVVKQLGRPKGSLVSHEQELLWYERGSVELIDGKVTSVKLMSLEDFRAQKEAARAEAEEEARRAAALKQEGEAERDRMLSDTNFIAKPAADQVAAWDAFKKKYPTVATDEQTKGVREKMQTDQAAAAQAQVAPAEKKAKPKLSSSKRRRYKRAGDTNMVDIATMDEPDATEP